MPTLGDILKDVTQPERWDSERIEQACLEMTERDEADFKFLLRSARNFAPLVRALYRISDYGECYCRDIPAKQCAWCEANAVLNEALKP